MKKRFLLCLCALMILCAGIAAADTSISALESVFGANAGEEGVTLSEMYPGRYAHIRAFPSSNPEGRRQSYAGPGKSYAGGGAYKPYKIQNVTAYFRENGYVFVHLEYQTVDDRYLYFSEDSFDQLPYVPTLAAGYAWTGRVLDTADPYWGPGFEYKTESEYRVTAGTPVSVLFEENGFVYGEFTGRKGLVRMWFPAWQVSR